MAIAEEMKIQQGDRYWDRKAVSEPEKIIKIGREYLLTEEQKIIVTMNFISRSFHIISPFTPVPVKCETGDRFTGTLSISEHPKTMKREILKRGGTFHEKPLAFQAVSRRVFSCHLLS